ncbi:MAG TPA: hypothetical protein VJ743_08990 [Albitalea sp.]|nr:hypothetical protein [Albitalea sp.]
MTNFAISFPRRPSRAMLAALLAAGALAAGVATLYMKRSPASAQGAGAAALPASSAQTAARVDQLVHRLASHPDDAAGWQELAQADVALHRYDDAVRAYQALAALHPGDATVLADQAYALAMARRRNLQGEPLALLGRALALDAHNPKALALSGTAAFDRQDYAGALRYWETLARTQPPGSVYARQVQPSIAEARRLGGIAAMTIAASAPPR